MVHWNRTVPRFGRLPRLAGAILTLAFAIAVALAAIPVSASGGTGDGDPHQSGCDTTAINLATAEHPDAIMTIVDPANGAIAGYGYLRYSTGCQSQWVTVTYNQGYVPGPGGPSFWLQNQTGTDLYASDFAPWGGKVWTWMYRNMRTRTGCGGVQMYHTLQSGIRGDYMGWYYIGCA